MYLSLLKYHQFKHIKCYKVGVITCYYYPKLYNSKSNSRFVYKYDCDLRIHKNQVVSPVLDCSTS